MNQQIERKKYADKINKEKYLGKIPFVKKDKKSFEKLLEFFLENVITNTYSSKLNKFKYENPTFPSFNGKKSEELELLSRTLIGYTFLSNNSSKKIKETYSAAIKEYTSKLKFNNLLNVKLNQIVVENTSIIIFFLLNKEVWKELPLKNKKNFIKIIKKDLRLYFWKNNWQWFRIFHLLFLELVNNKNPKDEIEKSLQLLDEMYLGDGWYEDGKNTKQIDHYNAWAMHYYGLMFCLLAPEKYKDKKEIFKQRFKEFFKSYKLLFPEKGLPLIWGRSQMYRFAILAPIGPAILLGAIQKEDYALCRDISSSTINAFLKENILDKNGLLKPSLLSNVSENTEKYSCQASPYWAMKAFSVLLIPKKHPFWKSKSTKQKQKESLFIKSINSEIVKKGNEIKLLNGGIGSRKYREKYNQKVFWNKY